MDLIVDKWDVDKYSLLTLDEYSPDKTHMNYEKLEIDGVVYQPEIVYDMPNTVAILRVKDNLVGKKVKYI